MKLKKVLVIIAVSIVVIALIAVVATRSFLKTFYQSIAFTSAIENSITSANSKTILKSNVTPGRITGLFGVTIPEIRINSQTGTNADFVLRDVTIKPNFVLAPLTRRVPFTAGLNLPTGGKLSAEGVVRFNWGLTQLKLQSAKISAVDLDTQSIKDFSAHFGSSLGSQRFIAAFSGKINGTATLDQQDLMNIESGTGKAEVLFTQAQFSLPQLAQLNLEVTPLKITWKNGEGKTLLPWQLTAKVMGQGIRMDISFTANYNKNTPNYIKTSWKIQASGHMLAVASIARSLSCVGPVPKSLNDVLNPNPKTMLFEIKPDEMTGQSSCTSTAGGQ